MSRRELREHIFKLLFRVEFNSEEEMKEQCDFFFDDVDTQFEEADMEYIRDKFEKIQEKLTEIDKLIDDNTKGWTTDRMSKVDLTIIRLGIYEMLYDEQIPESVAINEAVELAKRFGQDKSNAFVNAILAKFSEKKD